MIAEKRIMDLALEIEMPTFKKNESKGSDFHSGAAAPILLTNQNKIFFIITTETVPPIWT